MENVEEQEWRCFQIKDVIAVIQRGANALLRGDSVYEKEGMRFILKKE